MMRAWHVLPACARTHVLRRLGVRAPPYTRRTALPSRTPRQRTHVKSGCCRGQDTDYRAAAAAATLSSISAGDMPDRPPARVRAPAERHTPDPPRDPRTFRSCSASADVHTCGQPTRNTYAHTDGSSTCGGPPAAGAHGVARAEQRRGAAALAAGECISLWAAQRRGAAARAHREQRGRGRAREAHVRLPSGPIPALHAAPERHHPRVVPNGWHCVDPPVTIVGPASTPHPPGHSRACTQNLTTRQTRTPTRARTRKYTHHVTRAPRANLRRKLPQRRVGLRCVSERAHCIRVRLRGTRNSSF